MRTSDPREARRAFKDHLRDYLNGLHRLGRYQMYRYKVEKHMTGVADGQGWKRLADCGRAGVEGRWLLGMEECDPLRRAVVFVFRGSVAPNSRRGRWRDSAVGGLAEVGATCLARRVYAVERGRLTLAVWFVLIGR